MKRKRECQASERETQKDEENKWKYSVENNQKSNTTPEVDKLPPGKGANNFIFYFYELWNFKSHTNIVHYRYTQTVSACGLYTLFFFTTP